MSGGGRCRHPLVTRSPMSKHDSRSSPEAEAEAGDICSDNAKSMISSAETRAASLSCEALLACMNACQAVTNPACDLARNDDVDFRCPLHPDRGRLRPERPPGFCHLHLRDWQEKRGAHRVEGRDHRKLEPVVMDPDHNGCENAQCPVPVVRPAISHSAGYDDAFGKFAGNSRGSGSSGIVLGSCVPKV